MALDQGRWGPIPAGSSGFDRIGFEMGIGSRSAQSIGQRTETVTGRVTFAADWNIGAAQPLGGSPSISEAPCVSPSDVASSDASPSDASASPSGVAHLPA